MKASAEKQKQKKLRRLLLVLGLAGIPIMLFFVPWHLIAIGSSIALFVLACLGGFHDVLELWERFFGKRK